MNALLASDSVQRLLHDLPRQLVTDAVRDAIDLARRDPNCAPDDAATWAAAIHTALALREQRSLRRVINATGVILHTNLGRAPLAESALRAARDIGAGYSNLEYDLARGTRGSRYTHCVALLRELTGADDALVVNNGAAALLLGLNTLAERRDAVVSRGELVEIGGGFRVPDIMAKSGARLVEVGTTNRTHAEDYARALSPDTGALVKVHRGNFALEGFVAEVDVRTLSAIGSEHGVPVLYDLGSGQLLSLERYGLPGEPLASDAVRAGASCVTMSGDKLLGGPQAGIMLGRAETIERVRRNPLTRAFRIDKLTLAALEATLALYRDPVRAEREIPFLTMLATPLETLRERARVITDQLTTGGLSADVVESVASVGGGAFPTARVPSCAIVIVGNASTVDARLRAGNPPIVGRINDGRLLLDLRAVQPEDDERLAEVALQVLA